MQGILLVASDVDLQPDFSAAGTFSFFTKMQGLIVDSGNGVIYIALTIFAIIAVLSLLFVAVRLGLSGSRGKSIAKTDLIWIIGLSVLGFGIIGIVGMIYSVGQSLF